MNKVARPQGILRICSQCSRPLAPARPRPALLLTLTTPPSKPPTPSRPFTTTPLLQKKGGKQKSRDRDDSDSSSSKSSPAPTTAEDPYDFTDLEASISKAHTRLKDDLSQLRAGGRFNPAAIENLRVTLDKTSKSQIKLSDLAQVVPRGRTLNLIAGEKDHLKAISSAILSSDLSLTPQPDATNALQLNIPLPPPTKESRDQAVQQAVRAGEKAGDAVRNARGAMQKRLRGMQVAKSVRPDDLKKAGERMEKVVERGQGEVKRIVDAAKKVLESS